MSTPMDSARPVYQCGKQEAANALRNAAGPRYFGGPDEIEFGVIGTRETGVQKLNEAIMNLTLSREIAWQEHPSGYHLIVALHNRALRYKVKMPKRRDK